MESEKCIYVIFAKDKNGKTVGVDAVRKEPRNLKPGQWVLRTNRLILMKQGIDMKA